ncbi:MAG: glycosyltransferase, partial [Stackebrandtia sp.]
SQITHGRNGFLVDDPTDLPAFGEQVADLVNADGMPAIAESAHRTVRDSFLPDREIVATAEILGQATRVVI